MIIKNSRTTVLLLALLIGCKIQAASTDTTIIYTQIKDCIEQVENNNAAYSEISCPSIGNHKIEIKQQSPQYFIISLKKSGISASSELETYTLEAPIEPGKAIEWHLIDNKPKFMVFRIKSQTEKGDMTEILTLNLVTKDRICPLASIATKTTPQANEKIRNLIKNKFHETQECPTTILTI